MSRRERTDKAVFKNVDDAVDFGKTKHLKGYNLYKSLEGTFTVKRFTKTPGDSVIGCFKRGPGNSTEYVYYGDAKNKESDYNNNHVIKTGYKVIDGQKLANYIKDNGIDKKELCNKVYKSRAFINDCVKRNRMDLLCLETICDHLNLQYNFFDPVIEEPVEEKSEETIEYDYHSIHDDLVTLIASNKRLEALMLQMIEMWRND